MLRLPRLGHSDLDVRRCSRWRHRVVLGRNSPRWWPLVPAESVQRPRALSPLFRRWMAVVEWGCEVRRGMNCVHGREQGIGCPHCGLPAPQAAPQSEADICARPKCLSPRHYNIHDPERGGHVFVEPGTGAAPQWEGDEQRPLIDTAFSRLIDGLSPGARSFIGEGMLKIAADMFRTGFSAGVEKGIREQRWRDERIARRVADKDDIEDTAADWAKKIADAIAKEDDRG